MAALRCRLRRRPTRASTLRAEWAIKRICYASVQFGSGLREWAGVAYRVDDVADCLAGCGGVGFVGEE